MPRTIRLIIALVVVMSASLASGRNNMDDYTPHVFESSTIKLPYRMLPPTKVEPGKTYPLVIFLHGAGERGNDNGKQLKHVAGRFVENEIRANFPCYVVAPQCPGGQQWVDTPWQLPKHTMPPISKSMTALIELIGDMQKKHQVDATRIYAMGLSMGGFGTWDLAMRKPDLIAAAVPICGGADDSKGALLKDMPVWAFHGDKDTVVLTVRSRNIVAAIKAAGASPKYTEYPGVGHFSWNKAAAEPGLFEWLFEQRRGAAVVGVPRTFSSYHIGNSLTWDLQPTGIAQLSAQRGIKHRVGYHICCGKPLKHIWANPEDTCVKPVADFGRLRPALSTHAWDVVTIQPYKGATLGDDVRVITEVITLTRQNPANAKTRFVVHCAWPGEHGKDYAKQWLKAVSDDPSTPTVQARQYFEHVLKRVRANVDVPVEMVPAGEVLYVLDQKLRATPLPGLSSATDLYRDQVHLKTDVGRFAVAVAAQSVITGGKPDGLTKPAKAYGNAAAYSDAYYRLVYETVSEVIQSRK
jgi:poly(3-hydroxybutyrate) depolymerase